MFKKLTSIVSRIAEILETVVKFAAMAVLVVLLCVIFFQVVRRMITGNSFTEIEEFSIVMAAWLGFLTLSFAARKRVHVRIDVFANKFPLPFQHVLSMFITALTLYASSSLVVYGWQLTMKKAHVPLAILPMNAGWWYLAFPVGMALTSFFLLDALLQEISRILGITRKDEMEAN
nr:TRAP transporter small permease [uncultured Sphaerochaeta sp.]